jgi:DNA-binding transcriptional regulator YhcF (GntR family)
MQFRDNLAIYIQIAEHVCEKILLTKWKPGEKIISIRELAVTIEVNPNTVQRAYDLLQQERIIINRRGIGYFAAEDARDRILDFRREQFLENELPVFLRNLYLLQIDIDEVQARYERFVKKHFQNSK